MTRAANNDVVASLGFLQSFQLFSRDPSFNVDAVKKAYADSSIAVHFLYLTKMPAGKVSVNQYKLAEQGGSLTDEVILAEKSEDIYSAFNEVARATGGFGELLPPLLQAPGRQARRPVSRDHGQGEERVLPDHAPCRVFRHAVACQPFPPPARLKDEYHERIG
jgi:hypothetical protein